MPPAPPHFVKKRLLLPAPEASPNFVLASRARKLLVVFSVAPSLGIMLMVSGVNVIKSWS